MKCAMCNREPHEINEYVDIAKENNYVSAEQAVRYEEGTYHPTYNKFLCTSCYIKAGQPLRSDLVELYQHQMEVGAESGA